MLKVKVNLTEEKYMKLLEDIKLFKISKSDRTINKNKFMNLLFRNFYSMYEKKNEAIVDTINSFIKDDSLSREIMQKLENNMIDSKNNYFKRSLTFILNEENSTLFELIDNNKLMYISVSGYFRNLIFEYLSYPQYKREEIIYLDRVNKINEAISKNTTIFCKMYDETTTIKPYKLATSKEEVYTYLVGINDKNMVRTYNISTLSEIIIKNEPFTFTKDEKNLFEEIIKNGINFAYPKAYSVTIKLSDEGIKMFDRRYVNRPIPVSIDGNVYKFSCSFYQLKSYFLAFGKEAYIEGKRLRDEINLEYQNAIDAYKKKK